MSNYKGQLEGFPSEVVEKMLERQVEQGSKRDVGVFEKIDYADDSEGGFAWLHSTEEHDFWQKVIAERNFALFFSRYPKTGKEVVGKYEPREGDVVTNEYDVVAIYKKQDTALFEFYAALLDGHFYTGKKAFMDSLRPATREERCKFFERLVQEGYKWNTKKLKLTKVEKWAPKDGDFVHISENHSVYESIIIYHNGCEFYTGITTRNGILSVENYKKGISIIPDRPATDSERQRLLDTLRKEGKRWNAEKKCIEDIKPIYSIGDIVLINDGSIAIVSRIDTQGLYEISAVLISNSELRINNNNISMMFPSDFIKRKANKQEVSKLNEALAKAGYRRSAKMGAIEPLKWKPKMGEKYFIPSKKSKYGFNESIWSGSEFDVAYESIGIICRTQEEAQKMLK